MVLTITFLEKKKAWLKDVLNGIAVRHKKGSNKGQWELKPEFKSEKEWKSPFGEIVYSAWAILGKAIYFVLWKKQRDTKKNNESWLKKIKKKFARLFPYTEIFAEKKIGRRSKDPSFLGIFKERFLWKFLS